jgi:predicted acetyltransferase
LVVEVVDDADGVELFQDLSSRGFGLPLDFAQILTPVGLLESPAAAMLVGRVGEKPVSCALVSVTGATAGIYNVATPEEHRRRGYGAALTWAAIAEGARRGCDHSILQASDMGAPVYRAMGYVDVGRYVQLEGPPSSG